MILRPKPAHIHRNLILTGVFFISVLTGACSEPHTDILILHTLKGESIDLRAKRDRSLVINYWAAWCKPCRTEIPELNALQTQLADKVHVIGVNYDNPPLDRLRQESKQFDITFDVVTADPAALLGYARPTVLPTTMIINPQGQISATLVGPQTVESIQAALGSH